MTSITQGQVKKDPTREAQLRSIDVDFLVPRRQEVPPSRIRSEVVIQERNRERPYLRVREVVIVDHPRVSLVLDADAQDLNREVRRATRLVDRFGREIQSSAGRSEPPPGAPSASAKRCAATRGRRARPRATHQLGGGLGRLAPLAVCELRRRSRHRDGRPSPSIPPGVRPSPAFLFLPDELAATIRGMETRGFIERRGFWLLALLWLPAGVMATAAVRFGPGTGSAPPGMWVMAMVMSAGSLVFVAPCGLPLALGCRRVWRLGYRRGAWWAGTGLGAVTVAAPLLAGLLGPLAIAVYAAVISLPVWIAGWWLARACPAHARWRDGAAGLARNACMTGRRFCRRGVGTVS